MNKFLTFLLCLFFGATLFAQPINDNCDGIIDLGEAPICPSPAIYTNFQATESDIGNDNQPPCFNGTPMRDVWFSFVATAGFEDYAITATGVDDGLGSLQMTQPQIALYRGDACLMDELVLLDCESAGVGEGAVTLTTNGLTPGITYYLRINDFTFGADPNWGTFELCIEEFVQLIYTMDEGSSNACTGELYDTGGPNGNYGNNENLAFTICPDAPNSCILFNLANYNVQNNADQIFFFDGPTINSPNIGLITGGANGANHGGVCYNVAASSGCLTVQFVSNGAITFEGFQGFWECTTEDCPTPDPLELNVGAMAAEIEAALSNPLMDVTVTNINCDDGAYATFQTGDNTGLGLGEGLLLTTGQAAEVANPASFFASTDLNDAGDPDLDFLQASQGNGFNTGDACTVELDIFTKTDRVGFDYVFGSDEYKQTFSQFSNDLIGIMISGVGIPGNPGLNNQENIAELPSGELIQIQTVNASNNWEYYRNNLNSQTIAYNGLTADFLGTKKTLLAEQVVTPCNTYHVKISIGDTDENDDSGLFVTPSKQGVPTIAVNFTTGIDYLVEGCLNVSDNLVISLPNALTTDITYDVTISGTADLGLDYLLAIPAQVTIPAGQTSISFPIQAVPDFTVEGTETITINLSADYGCGVLDLTTFNLTIEDELLVQILPDQDTIFVCDGINTVQLQAVGAASFQWSPSALFNDATSTNPIATVNTNTFVTVTGELGTCTAEDVAFLQIIAPEVTIEADGDTNICEGESISLTATNNVNNSGLTWSPTGGLDEPSNATVIASPVITTTYTAMVEASGGCTASDEITITVEPFDVPVLTTLDTLICQNSSVVLAAPITNTSTVFEWTPTTGLDNATLPNPTATPDVSTTYTFTATSVNGLCTETGSVTINVLPADVDIQPDTIFMCLGDSIELVANTSTSGVGLTWSPADSLSSTTDEVVTAFPAISTWYVASLEVGSCLVKDSVYVRVDSLPDLTIEAIPSKESYCEGEVITLISVGYPAPAFPDIMHQWSPTIGADSPDSLLNFVVLATETTVYQRITNNNACVDTSEIEIIVTPTPDILITPENPAICAGESVQLEATSDTIEEFEWSPMTGLSCTDCPDPLATPPVTLTYQVTGEFNGCPGFANVTVTIASSPALDFVSDPNICLGESVALIDNVDPTATYEWTLEDGTVFSNDPSPVVMPTETTTYNVFAENGCESTGSITINVWEEPIFEFPADASICQGEILVLNLVEDPTASYQWTDSNGVLNETDPNPSYAPLQSTTVFLNIFNPGCSVDASLAVEVSEAPLFDLPNDTTVCAGTSITLNTINTPGASYQWTASTDIFTGNDNAAVPAPQTPDVTTTYTVEGTLNDCVVNYEVTITIADDYEVTVPENLSICDGEEVTLTATTNTDNVTFQWFFEDSLVSTSASYTPDTIASDESMYTLNTVDAGGCFPKEGISIIITEYESVVIDSFHITNASGALVDSVEVVEGQELDLTVFTNPPNNALTNPMYEWTLNDVVIATTEEPFLNGVIAAEVLDDNLESQAFEYGVTVTHGASCQDAVTQTLDIFNNEVQIPNAFTPNGDEVNNFFRLVTRSEDAPVAEILEFRVYNRWGQKVYDNENGTEGWNGMHNDKPAASDVYAYYIAYKVTADSEVIIAKGDVTLLR